MRIRRYHLAVAMLVAALGLVATVVYAQGQETKVLDQWKTTVQHSKFSQNYANTKEITSHLQHVVNCIEGQRGPLYDGGVGNPCQGQGSGLITDSKAAGGKYTQAVPLFEVADEIAATGLKTKSVEKAKTAGWATQMVLERAGEILK